MASKKYKLLFALMLLSIGAFAQKETNRYNVYDTSVISSKKMPQQNEFWKALALQPLHFALPFPYGILKPLSQLVTLHNRASIVCKRFCGLHALFPKNNLARVS